MLHEYIIQTMAEQQIQIQMGDYVFTQRYCIGQGSFGKVYRGRNIRTGREVAIKQMDSQLVGEKQIGSQISILKKLKHPNILEYQQAFQSKGYFYIVTQYCKGGDLRNMMDSDQEDNPNKFSVILEMIWQVCEGFNYLKKHDIIHRDLKPSNILIYKMGKYKIADFGLARQQLLHKSSTNRDLMGVPAYMSPQLLSKNYYTYKCDVWSLGIIVFEMIFERLPWKAQDVQSLFFLIMNNPQPYIQKDQNIQIPDIFKLFFKKTLTYLQSQRASWAQLLQLRQNQKKPVFLKQKQRILSIALPNNIHSSIQLTQLQILKHIYTQARSLQEQLLVIIQQQYLTAMYVTIAQYVTKGGQCRSILRDCFYMFLKVVQNKLYLQLMEYQHLQQSRPMLNFIELIHDFLVNIENSKIFEQKYFQGSLRKNIISQYAASVISKINTLIRRQQ